MHKLIDYVCRELEDIESKAEKGNLSMAEIQYADTLAHLKKNLMKADMMASEMDYSNRGYTSRTGSMYPNSYNMGNSYRRRDGRGSYSRDNQSMIDQLRDMANEAPNEATRQDIHRLISKLEGQM